MDCYYECGKDVDELVENKVQVGVNSHAYACPECRAWASDWKRDDEGGGDGSER